MKTKKITLYYSVGTREITPPGPGELECKEQWLRVVQASVEADYKPKTIRVTYQVYDPDITNQRKFLEGPVVEYWLIQSQDLADHEPSPEEKKKARETLLDRVLGYDVEMMDRTVRRRRTTTDFTETQQWHDFLEMLRETEFEPNGYEFPDSEYFWEQAKAYGYEKAKGIVLTQLRDRLKAKLG